VGVAVVALLLAGTGAKLLLDGDDEGSVAPIPQTATTAPPADGDTDEAEEDEKERGGEKERGEKRGAAGGSADRDRRTGPGVEQDPTGGPGGGGDEGPPADVAAVKVKITAYLLAIHAGDGKKACAQLSDQGRRKMERKLARIAPETEGSACEQSILLYQGAYQGAIRNPSVKRVRVSGASATAIGPLREPAELSRSGEGWAIDEYGQ
jgi:hypothetical protein